MRSDTILRTKAVYGKSSILCYYYAIITILLDHHRYTTDTPIHSTEILYSLMPSQKHQYPRNHQSTTGTSAARTIQSKRREFTCQKTMRPTDAGLPDAKAEVELDVKLNAAAGL